MNTILWVALIDKSGSMGRPFSATSGFDGFTETGEYATKLDAAKHALLRQVKGFGARTTIAVLAFADKPELIFRGSPDQVEQLAAAVMPLQARGNTDIAAALYAGIETQKQSVQRRVRFLLISDGLSTAGDPVQASEQCVNEHIDIDTILIDPTPEGEAIARTISVGGRVTAVTSTAALEEAVEQSRVESIKAEREAISRPIVACITGIAAILSMLLLLLTTFVSARKEPAHYLPAIGALTTLLFAAGLVYMAFARVRTPLYVNPHKLTEYFPRYSKKLRVLCGCLSAFFFLVTVGLVSLTIPYPRSSARDELRAMVTSMAGPNVPPTAREIQPYRKIAHGSSLKEVFLSVGVPDDWRNLPPPTYIYRLSNGSVVQVVVSAENLVIRVTLTGSDGSVWELTAQ